MQSKKLFTNNGQYGTVEGVERKRESSQRIGQNHGAPVLCSACGLEEGHWPYCENGNLEDGVNRG